MRRIALLCALIFSVLSVVTPVRSVAAAPLANPMLQRVVELVNQRRAEAGLAPVTVNVSLMSCAQQYSEVQSMQAGISHTGPDGSNPGQRLTRCGYRWRYYGEDLAAGFNNADAVMNAWMNSPSHRKVIMNPKYKEIGLGYAYRADDPGQYFDYIVMEMGTRK